MASLLPRTHMLGVLRWSAYGLVTGLWLSGCAWLALHWFASAPGEFGPVAHPALPTLILIHGVLAVPMTYLLGWFSPGHALVNWRLRLLRGSGGLLWLGLVVLTASGFSLFYVNADIPRTLFSGAHEVIGLALALAALPHWLKARQLNGSVAPIDSKVVERQSSR